MSAGRYDFTIEQGSTFELNIKYRDSNGLPVNLTGFYGRMQVRPTKTSDIVYLDLSSSLQPDGTGLNFSGSGNNQPPSSGSVGIYISSCTSSLLDFNGQAYYDLEIYSGSAHCPYTIRLIEGLIMINKEVTK